MRKSNVHDCWICGIYLLNFEQSSTWNRQAVVIFSPGLHVPPFDQGSTSQKPLSTGSIRTHFLDAAFVNSVKRKKGIFSFTRERKRKDKGVGIIFKKFLKLWKILTSYITRLSFSIINFCCHHHGYILSFQKHLSRDIKLIQSIGLLS